MYTNKTGETFDSVYSWLNSDEGDKKAKSQRLAATLAQHVDVDPEVIAAKKLLSGAPADVVAGADKALGDAMSAAEARVLQRKPKLFKRINDHLESLGEPKIVFSGPELPVAGVPAETGAKPQEAPHPAMASAGAAEEIAPALDGKAVGEALVLEHHMRNGAYRRPEFPTLAQEAVHDRAAALFALNNADPALAEAALAARAPRLAQGTRLPPTNDDYEAVLGKPPVTGLELTAPSIEAGEPALHEAGATAPHLEAPVVPADKAEGVVVKVDHDLGLVWHRLSGIPFIDSENRGEEYAKSIKAEGELLADTLGRKISGDSEVIRTEAAAYAIKGEYDAKIAADAISPIAQARAEYLGEQMALGKYQAPQGLSGDEHSIHELAGIVSRRIRAVNANTEALRAVEDRVLSSDPELLARINAYFRKLEVPEVRLVTTEVHPVREPVASEAARTAASAAESASHAEGLHVDTPPPAAEAEGVARNAESFTARLGKVPGGVKAAAVAALGIAAVGGAVAYATRNKGEPDQEVGR